MKTRKRMPFTRMAVMLLCSMSLMALPAAAAGSTPERELQAQALCAMGLFKGYDNSGKNFGLNDLLTREHALTFLVRILGEERTALAWKGATPYTDVTGDSWALPYIGYAEEKGYTVGIGDKKFGMGRNATMQEMTMFTLRGLGYSDAAAVKDFDDQSSLKLAKEKGLLSAEQPVTPFTRGEALVILFNATEAPLKGQDYKLLETLLDRGVVSDAQYESGMAILEGKSAEQQQTEDQTASPDEIAIKANVKMLNSTDRSIRDFYISESDSARNYSDDFLSAHNYRAWTSGMGITTGFVFYKTTSFDFYVRFTDGMEAEATELSFADATSAGGTITVNADTITLTVGGKLVSTVPLTTKGADLDANSKTVTDRFNASVKRYNGLVDQVNDLGMSKDAAFTKSMNGITTELDEMTEVIGEGTGKLSVAQVTEYTKALNALDGFMNDMEGLIKTVSVASDATEAASKKLSERFASAVKRYDAQVDQVNMRGFSNDADFVKNMNGITEVLDKMSPVIGKGTSKLTEAQIKEYSTGLDALDGFMNQLDSRIKTAKTKTIPITIINNTGVNLTGLYLSTTKETTWGDSLGSLVGDGKVIVDVSYTSSAPVWDLRAENAAGDPIHFIGLNFSKCAGSGAVLTLRYNESTQTGHASLK